MRLEQKAANKKGAIYNLSKGLKECATDGELWSIAIEMEPKATRKKKIVDALDKCQDDPFVNLSVAKLFWKERKYEKAKKWIEKAVLLNKAIGDSWACLYLFEKTAANDQQEASKVLQQIMEIRPKEGRIWNQVRKSEEAFTTSDSKKIEWIIARVITIVENELSTIE